MDDKNRSCSLSFCLSRLRFFDIFCVPRLYEWNIRAPFIVASQTGSTEFTFCFVSKSGDKVNHIILLTKRERKKKKRDNECVCVLGFFFSREKPSTFIEPIILRGASACRTIKIRIDTKTQARQWLLISFLSLACRCSCRSGSASVAFYRFLCCCSWPLLLMHLHAVYKQLLAVPPEPIGFFRIEIRPVFPP